MWCHRRPPRIQSAERRVALSRRNISRKVVGRRWWMVGNFRLRHGSPDLLALCIAASFPLLQKIATKDEIETWSFDLVLRSTNPNLGNGNLSRQGGAATTIVLDGSEERSRLETWEECQFLRGRQWVGKLRGRCDGGGGAAVLRRRKRGRRRGKNVVD